MFHRSSFCFMRKKKGKEKMECMISCSCGYCASSYEDLICDEWDEIHTELDDNSLEHFISYACPLCGSTELEERYLDDDQEFFADGAWHEVYDCNESCEECNRNTFGECTRSIKMSQKEWSSERREFIKTCCNHAYDIVTLIAKVNKLPQYQKKNIQEYSFVSQRNQMIEYLDQNNSDMDAEYVKKMKRLLNQYRRTKILQEATKIMIRLGALESNVVNFTEYDLVMRLMAM